MKREHVLAHISKYEEHGVKLPENLTSFSLAKKFAHSCQREDELIKILQYIPNTALQVYYLKHAGFFKIACERLMKEKSFQEVFRIYAAQGMYAEGIQLCKDMKNTTMLCKFIFLKAKSELSQRNRSEEGLSLSKELEAKSQLKHIISSSCKCDELSVAKAYLFLGTGTCVHDENLLEKAFNLFCKLQHAFGAFVAFCEMIREKSHVLPSSGKTNPVQTDDQQDYIDIRKFLEVLKNIFRLIESENHNISFERGRKQIEDFLDLEQGDSFYFVPQDQIYYFWKEKVKPSSVDDDGMLKIEIFEVRKMIQNRIYELASACAESIAIEKFLIEKLCEFCFHKHIVSDDNGALSCTIDSKELSQYLEVCSLKADVFQHLHRNGEDVDLIVSKCISNLFSPAVSVFLPSDQRYLRTLRKSKPIHKMIEKCVQKSLQDDGTSLDIDKWMNAWRMLSACADKNAIIHNELKKRVRQGNIKAPACIKIDETSVHVFSQWIKSCELIRLKTRTSFYFEDTFFRFLLTLIKRRLLFSSENLIDILSIHCTALLVILSRFTKYSLVIPSKFQQAIQFFDTLNCASRDDRTVLVACNVIHADKQKAIRFLCRMLDILLGKECPEAPVIERILKCAQTFHLGLCLVLTIFANLLMIPVPEESKMEYFRLVQNLFAKEDIIHSATSQRFSLTCSTCHPSDIFIFIAEILHAQNTAEQSACILRKVDLSVPYKIKLTEISLEEVTQIVQANMARSHTYTSKVLQPNIASSAVLQNSLDSKGDNAELSDDHSPTATGIVSGEISGYSSTEAGTLDPFSEEESTDFNAVEDKTQFIDTTFCGICGVHLKPEDDVEADQNLETHDIHTQGSDHTAKLKAFERFQERVSEEFSPIAVQVDNLIQQSNSILETSDIESLQISVTKAKSKLTKEKKGLKNIKFSLKESTCKWVRAGFDLIDTIKEVTKCRDELRKEYSKTVELIKSTPMSATTAVDDEFEVLSMESETDRADELDEPITGNKLVTKENKRRAKKNRKRKT